jgi:hypothetical protein
MKCSVGHIQLRASGPILKQAKTEYAKLQERN